MFDILNLININDLIHITLNDLIVRNISNSPTHLLFLKKSKNTQTRHPLCFIEILWFHAIIMDAIKKQVYQIGVIILSLNAIIVLFNVQPYNVQLLVNLMIFSFTLFNVHFTLSGVPDVKSAKLFWLLLTTVRKVNNTNNFEAMFIIHLATWSQPKMELLFLKKI